MSNGIVYGIITLASAAALVGSSIEYGRAVSARRDVPVVTVTAGDFYFQSADTLSAGMTTIRLVNKGPELHHAQIVRIEAGHTLKELLDVASKGGAVPKWARMVGGPNASAPGADASATLDLKPGSYAIVCFVPSPDGTPHFMKGMFKGLVVLPSREPSAAAPKADAEMKLDDYSFTFSTPLVAGRRTIAVHNVAVQPHEVLIVELAPGKTAHQVLQWIEKPNGPPPGRPIGGTTFLETKAVNYVTADFAVGRYALLCFFPDEKDCKPHFLHGMIKEFDVAAAH